MPTSGLGGRRGPRRATTEDEILDAALTLLDQGGAAAVSVRGIAARVGVAPNAVYTYFPDKAAVVKALVERLLSEVNQDVFADRTQPWRSRVEALALELRQRLTAHPGVVPLMISRPLNGPQALAMHEAVLELLADAGLSPIDAPRTSYLMFTYMVGSIALLVADVEEPGPLPSEAEWIAARMPIFAGTPAEPYPRAAAAAAIRAAYISTDQYLWGLHRLLDGIVAHVAILDESSELATAPRTESEAVDRAAEFSTPSRAMAARRARPRRRST